MGAHEERRGAHKGMPPPSPFSHIPTAIPAAWKGSARARRRPTSSIAPSPPFPICAEGRQTRARHPRHRPPLPLPRPPVARRGHARALRTPYPLPHPCGREANEGAPPSTPPPSPLAAPPCGAEGTRKGTVHHAPPSPFVRKGGAQGHAAPVHADGEGMRMRAHGSTAPSSPFARKGGAQGYATLVRADGDGMRTRARRPQHHPEHRTPAPSLSHLRGRGGAREQGRGGAAGEAERRRGVLPPCVQGRQEGGVRGHEGSSCACVHHARPPFLPATVLLRYKD
ncbi:hypothetical protein H4582DRAFT_2063983 [Lactarius indigo]|nr:hypothetical protein H4582DRAFT_2063983 [Lactarius indigo]